MEFIESLQRFLLNPHNDTKRLAELQKEFAAIWHANKCIKVNATTHCSLPMCPKWRAILNHYSSCNSGYECLYQSCGSSRVLIDHYNSCTDLDCRFCGPLRKCSTKKTIVCTEIRSSAGASTSEFAASISKGYCSGDGWTESACSARAAYFSTYNNSFTGDHRISSYQFMSTSFSRRPYYGKTERLQRELLVMFHVQKCSELDHKEASRDISCTVPHCPKMKRTLIHVAMCQGEHCKFPECDVTRTIIQHWLRCPKRHCDVCCPVLSSIPALDEGSDCELDDKLLALLYTSTNGLIDIASSDVSSYENDWSCNNDLCYDEEKRGKRKFSVTASSTHDSTAEKIRRVD